MGETMRFRVYALAFLVAPGCAALCAAAPIAPNLPGNWGLSFDQEFGAMPSPSSWVQSLWGETSFSGEL